MDECKPLLLGIANRLSAIGVTQHGRVTEYMWFCAGIIIFALFMSLIYTNYISDKSCDSPCVVGRCRLTLSSPR